MRDPTPAEARRELEQRALEVTIPTQWRDWLRELFPQYCSHDFGEQHVAFWEWLWAIRPDVRPKPFVAIWSRGAAKSTSGEMAVVAIGARKIRKYVLYISGTQQQADDHVGNIGAMLEGQELYPLLRTPELNMKGTAKGWRRNRLWTAGGLVVDALGLDTAARGVKLEEDRPGMMLFDDLDESEDSVASTEKKEQIITRKLLPAGANGLAVLFIQNLVKDDGVFGRLVSGEADYLTDKIISGPIPALKDMVTVGNAIISGTPTWEGQDLERCQQMVDDFGMRAFMAECQHDVGVPDGGMFSHVDFRHEEYTPELLASLDRVVCWVDPAVSDTDRSDANGIQIDGIRGQVKYRLFSWEQRSSPLETLKVAIAKAVEYGAQHVGIETDQGGDTWRSVYKEACQSLGITSEKAPGFVSRKAGAGFGSKQHRAQQMLVDYERQKIVHVVQGPDSTHNVLERALRRFPIQKPYDLVDASWHSWFDLNRGGGGIRYMPHPTRSGRHIPQWPLEDMTRPQLRRALQIQNEEQKLLAARELIKKGFGG